MAKKKNDAEIPWTPEQEQAPPSNEETKPPEDPPVEESNENDSPEDEESNEEAPPALPVREPTFAEVKASQKLGRKNPSTITLTSRRSRKRNR